jgi:hypothetical protein
MRTRSQSPGRGMLINAILTDKQLNAHPATPNDLLDNDD